MNEGSNSISIVSVKDGLVTNMERYGPLLQSAPPRLTVGRRCCGWWTKSNQVVIRFSFTAVCALLQVITIFVIAKYVKREGKHEKKIRNANFPPDYPSFLDNSTNNLLEDSPSLISDQDAPGSLSGGLSSIADSEPELTGTAKAWHWFAFHGSCHSNAFLFPDRVHQVEPRFWFHVVHSVRCHFLCACHLRSWSAVLLRNLSGYHCRPYERRRLDAVRSALRVWSGIPFRFLLCALLWIHRVPLHLVHLLHRRFCPVPTIFDLTVFLSLNRFFLFSYDIRTYWTNTQDTYIEYYGAIIFSSIFVAVSVLYLIFLRRGDFEKPIGVKTHFNMKYFLRFLSLLLLPGLSLQIFLSMGAATSHRLLFPIDWPEWNAFYYLRLIVCGGMIIVFPVTCYAALRVRLSRRLFRNDLTVDCSLSLHRIFTRSSWFAAVTPSSAC